MRRLFSFAMFRVTLAVGAEFAQHQRLGSGHLIFGDQVVAAAALDAV